MYFADTARSTVLAFDFDVETGEIANKQSFFEGRGGEAFHPDGSCIDAEGCLWIACFGIGRVLRVDPRAEW